MFFTRIIEQTRSRFAKRAEYNRIVSEIESMTPRDLADFNGNRADMLHQAYKQVYG